MVRMSDYCAGMQLPTQGFQRLLIVGLPRCGTTLVASLLAAQPGFHFLTDYFPAFTDVLRRLRQTWDGRLTPSQRRIALAVVRDQFLRVRHPVLVKLDSFATVDELHRLVMMELASVHDKWVGHKLLMEPAQLRLTLQQTSIRCLIMFRDPRDAALSYFHRTGGGVEAYLRIWREMVLLWRDLEQHPNLLGLRFEDLIGMPALTLKRLGDWLGMEIDSDVPELQFQRTRAHGATSWRENSAFQDVSQRFGRQPVGRWRSQRATPIVRYAGWIGAHELDLLGYEQSANRLTVRERWNFACLRALELAEQHAHSKLSMGSQWMRKHLILQRSGWIP